jgi:glutathione synthase/RimK-type ligase-like ATP-grasp enzyme
MKRIAILFGQERAFPLALIDRINGLGVEGIVAETAKLGGVTLEPAKPYDLILDRISQDIPFYRAALKKFAASGTIVVNNPFWWSADDKFFNNVLARSLGVAVPKTVLLPSNQHPPDTTSESMSNLEFPLDWDAIFSYVGFPAFFKPHSGGGWKNVYRVSNPEEFFGAYRASGQNVMTLQEEIVFEQYFRCYAIGRKHVRMMRYEPRAPFHERYVRAPDATDPALAERIHSDSVKLTGALGYDFNTLEFAVRDGIPYAIDFLNPAPDADPGSVGQENYEWVLETAARWLIDRVAQPAEPAAEIDWQRFLTGGDGKRTAAARPPRPRRAPVSRRTPGQAPGPDAKA